MKAMHKEKTYIIYNTVTLEVVAQKAWCTSAVREFERIKQSGIPVALINRTHPLNAYIVASLKGL